MTVTELPDRLQSALNGIETVSDKIRLLDHEGFARADIARILDKRYQHVRNVLEADAKKARETESVGSVGPSAVESVVFRITVGRDGALMLPPEALRALGLAQGGVLSARFDQGELRLAEPVTALRNVQKMLAPLRERLRREGLLASEELIAERRAEAAREAGE